MKRFSHDARMFGKSETSYRFFTSLYLSSMSVNNKDGSVNFLHCLQAPQIFSNARGKVATDGVAGEGEETLIVASRLPTDDKMKYISHSGRGRHRRDSINEEARTGTGGVPESVTT